MVRRNEWHNAIVLADFGLLIAMVLKERDGFYS